MKLNNTVVHFCENVTWRYDNKRVIPRKGKLEAKISIISSKLFFSTTTDGTPAIAVNWIGFITMCMGGW